MAYELKEERPHSAAFGLPWSVYVTTEEGDRILAAAFLTKADAEQYKREIEKATGP